MVSSELQDTLPLALAALGRQVWLFHAPAADWPAQRAALEGAGAEFVAVEVVGSGWLVFSSRRPPPRTPCSAFPPGDGVRPRLAQALHDAPSGASVECSTTLARALAGSSAPTTTSA